MNARAEILARISGALRDVPASERPEDVEVSRGYRQTEDGPLVAQFVERLVDYRTAVERVSPGGLVAAITDACRARGARRLAVPGDLAGHWRPAGVQLVPELELEVQALDTIDGALTGCALAVAGTGTIVFDGGARQGSRLLTLVPDFHLCVVEERQIVGSIPEAMTAIAATLRSTGRPVTLVSGPSATSDIELSRVEGVHGPRTLVVLVTSDAGFSRLAHARSPLDPS